ncbi:MAG: hypothetical protein JJ850_01915 [Kordiimonadaceae bacterium]|nr:hypothetical protein [Kordiimonadaceae bacterium]MBO6567441.1 hypothetical protein [Kordiimonadaceae bacterium]MBO6963345.1 hypothetical protein [Kordiimonadaceae bacterium]
METKFKRLKGLGLTAALLSTTALAACSGESGEGEHGEGEGGEAVVEQTVGERGESGEGERGEGESGEGERGESGEGEGGEGESGEGESGEGESGEGERGEGESGEGEGGEGESGEGEGGEGGHSMDTLPVENRLAFMTGHVKAGISLYRAGEASMGAPHLLHPVSETHQAERAGLDALGFDASLFETVSAALDAGKPAAEIEPQLRAAEENLSMVAEKAGGDAASVITYLMGVIVEEYTIAITDGAVTDPGEYQDAWGFAQVAKDRAASLPGDTRDAVIAEIDALIALWPAAPIPPESPAPIAQVVAQTSRVLLRL